MSVINMNLDAQDLSILQDGLRTVEARATLADDPQRALHARSLSERLANASIGAAKAEMRNLSERPPWPGV